MMSTACTEAIFLLSNKIDYELEISITDEGTVRVVHYT